MNLVLFGPQGCGKGTQAEMLVKKYSLAHISPGELFRKEVAKGSAMGKKLKEYMDKGLLVPKEYNNAIVKDALAGTGFTNFILDGFPRNIEQAEYLDSITNIDIAIEIGISDEEAVKRISSRFSCSKCSKGYNTIYIPPKKKGVCDDCGGRLVQRDDDTPAAVRKRLAIYHEQTEPLKKYYAGKFMQVNGEQPIESVFKEIEKILNKKK